MPTLEHDGFVDLFRENPAIAPRFLSNLFHVQVPPHASVAIVESSLDQLIPVEFRADLVLELRDAGGVRVLAIVVEVQRDEDPDKKYSWPVYLTVVRARKRCPACVLVITADAAVAAWAAESIDLGLGRCVAPLVLGPSLVPAVTDPTQANEEAELAILSAVVHGNEPNGLDVVLAAIDALGRFDRDRAAVYFQIIYNALRAPMRRAVEAWFMERQSEVKAAFPPFIQRLMDGRELEGELKGKRDALLRVVARAGIALGEDERARIEACADLATLDRWFDNALEAKTSAEVFK